MSKLVVFDIDTQVDFMLPGRSLYVQDAERILPTLRALTEGARRLGIRRLASEDAHQMGDPEISPSPDWVTTYPPHCLARTAGQARVPETRAADPLVLGEARVPLEGLRERLRRHRGEVVFRKRSVDVFSNPNVEPALDALQPSAVALYGVALDVCVRLAVEGLLRRGREAVALVTDATRALDPSRGERLLEEWRARGVRLVTSADVLVGACGRGAAPERRAGAA